LQGITGVDKAKVHLAAKLGVSPYSTNRELQEQLTNTARAMAGGGLIVNIAAGAVGGAARDVITVLTVNQKLPMRATLANPPVSSSIRQRKTKLAFQAPADEIANAGGDSEKIGGLR
jgi:hypothetical protein